MRFYFPEFDFVIDTLRRGGLYAIGGGFVVLVIGFVINQLEMVAAGGLVTILGAVDYVVTAIIGKRRSD